MPKRWRRWSNRRCSKPASAFAALDRLAVTTGPGTFTGQRVGLAFMRGLRVALKKPLIGMTTLEAMAAAAMADRNARAAIHDARRDEAYLLLWEGGEIVLPPTVLPFAEAVARIRAFGPCALCRHRRGRREGRAWAQTSASPRSASPMRCGWRGWR